jgi:hypothetical protein
MSVAGAPARAETRDDVLSGIQRCGVIHDDRTWLECLYGADQPMRAKLGLPPAPEFQQRLVPPLQPGVAVQPAIAMQPDIAAPEPRSVARPAPRKKSGFFRTLMGDVPPVATSRMASYRYEPSGAFVVTLQNGQEWRQTDVGGGTVSWIKPPAKYLVTITPGVFGSFTLHTDDGPSIYKVELVK